MNLLRLQPEMKQSFKSNLKRVKNYNPVWSAIIFQILSFRYYILRCILVSFNVDVNLVAGQSKSVSFSCHYIYNLAYLNLVCDICLRQVELL